jgi:tRNA pseudouridine38-40 synthase
MVRKMVGTLVDVGRGKLTPDDIPALFAMRDRSKSGPTMPPHGLCMVEVEYASQPNSLAIHDVQSASESQIVRD